MISTITLRLKFIDFELRSSNVSFVSEAALYIFHLHTRTKYNPPPLPPPHTHIIIIIIIIIIIVIIIIIIIIINNYYYCHHLKFIFQLRPGTGSFESLKF